MRAAVGLTCVLLSCVVRGPTPALADDSASVQPPVEPPPTFSYTTPVEPDYARALFELSGVFTVGFLWYVTQTDIGDDYDVNYSWPVFRKKLTGEAVGFDTNHFGTNFIGHPLGGTAYYLAARSNRLSIAASLGIATGGSLLWEYFGEAREVVSLNDMIVTPLAGFAIGEPLTQLGAFFDRSRPSWRNRILGGVFAPLKSLNDLFDGAKPARAERVDRYGFPTDEGHEFNLGVGWAATFVDPRDGDEPPQAAHEFRLALGSRLARLPGYNDAGQHSRLFADANVSSITLAGAFDPSGLLDLHFETEFVVFGYYLRNAWNAGGALWGHDLVVGITAGYRYSVHDYDRAEERPLDRISSVQPVGLLLEHRGLLGAVRTTVRLQASPSFAGITPYALPAPSEAELELPGLIGGRQYYFGLGGGVAAMLSAGVGPFEVQGALRFERHAQVDGPNTARDQRMQWSVRASSAIPSTPIRASAFVEQRLRRGNLGEVRAAGGELSVGLEIGSRF